MITGQLRSKIDKLWEEFWTGGVTNPLTVIEQISFLMFSRLLDQRESTEEKKWNRKHKDKPFPGVFYVVADAREQAESSDDTSENEGGEKEEIEDEQHLRWEQFRHLGGDEMLEVVRDGVFPHFRKLGERNGGAAKNTFAEYMRDATLMINKPSLLVSAVTMVHELPLTKGDTKGDLYEYLLGKLTTAGINGQFRTPRHIIRLMADLILEGAEEEAVSWTVGDPACGTGGFLVSFIEALRERYTSEEGKLTETITVEKGPRGEKTEEEVVTYTGDLLEPYRKHIQSGMLHGFDFDATMLRIAAMNLMLHGVDTPDIHYQDTLSNSFPDKFAEHATEGFDLILANPPFKGSLDAEDVHPTLTSKVKTKKTELLFLVLMLRMLKLGGRCAVIVPDGVLFGSSKAHKSARQQLVEDNQLEAVVKLPAGVFKPYAGVSTAILFFTKGGETTDVWFYDVAADGYSLDDKRDPVDQNDLPDVRQQWAAWRAGYLSPRSKKYKEQFEDRTAKAFYVPKDEIASNGYDLSLNRYKEIVYEEVEYDPPNVIIGRLRELEDEIATDLNELEAMLG